jgi:hypothetical protein
MLEKLTGNRLGLTRVSDDIWIVDDIPINAAGLLIPIRMTVIRLSDGNLLLHSPVRFSPALRAQLEREGPIRYLLAPNVGHWKFLQDWQAAMPDVITFAVPGLASRRQVRAAAVRIDRELDDVAPEEWADDLEVVLVSAPMFSEVEIFDKRSRTLVLTDIVQNLDPNNLSPLAQVAARLLGISRPDGKAPIYLRLLLHLGGRSVQAAAQRLVNLDPQRVIFAHGDWFATKGSERLRRSLRWLLPVSGPSKEMTGC